MIRRITLENYMSHALTVIEPADGLTVLVGPNNCGKSAVFSALLSVCGETDSDYMLRHGEKLATVTIETEDGHTIVWKRKAKSAAYVIDGTEVSRIGRGNLPDGLHDLLKLPVMESADGKRKFHVHFGFQKEPIFLLDSESDTAAFFSSSAEAERMLEMQKLHKQKERQAKGQQREVQGELKRLGEKLEALAPLDAIASPLSQIELEHDALLAQAAAIELLERRIAEIQGLAAKRDHLRVRCAALDALRPPPPLADVTPLAKTIAIADRLLTDVLRQAAAAAATESLAAPPAMANVAAVDKLIAEIGRTDRAFSWWTARAEVTHALAGPPQLADNASLATLGKKIASMAKASAANAATLAALDVLHEPPVPLDPSPLKRAIANLVAAGQNCGRLGARAAALSSLVEPPESADLAPISALANRFSKATVEAKRESDKAAEAVELIGKVERKMVAWVTQNPLCPTCGAAMEPDRLLSGGHVHG